MFIVADIGGTNMRIAASRDLETFEEPVIVDTPQDYKQALDIFVATVKKAIGDEHVEGVVAGLPVLLSEDKRSIVSATNLPQWSGKSFADDINAQLNAPVYLENDVTLVGLGEATRGAGAGVRDVIYITVSTGVNGVHVREGIVVPTLGISTGRQYVSMEEPVLTWEEMISGRAIREKYGKPPRELGKDWNGWKGLARVTAFGINNTLVHWQCDRVVLGGSMFNEVGISVEDVRIELEKIWKATPSLPEIVHSQLGSVGGLYGGLARLKQLR